MRYRICKDMGWDFYTYEGQPIFFLEEIMIFLMQESNKEKQSIDSLNAKIKPAGPMGHKRT